MTNSTHICKFCRQSNIIQMYESKCSICNVEYTIHYNQITTMFFALKDPIIYALYMHLVNITTTVWLHPIGPIMNKIIIPKIWPEITPQQALPLSKKLIKLVAFS